jgi:ribose-phosphate pyrophosphokinase
MVLNLDRTFCPFPMEQEIEFESFTFAGGEPHIKINPEFDTTQAVNITHRLNSFNDLGLLCITVDALRRMAVQRIRLFIPYFPAARQDRVMVKGEPLSVKVYADLINALQFDRVTVFDPHSEVTAALVQNCDVVSNHKFIKTILASLPNGALLVSPDGGALKKIYKVSEYLGGVDVVECSKSRDVKTGKLTGFKVYADDLNGADCLIVDDICDGGGTFIGLAAELKKRNAGLLYLAVSHGIFSKGFDELAACFTTIFTTDSVKNLTHNNLIQIKLSNGLLS